MTFYTCELVSTSSRESCDMVMSAMLWMVSVRVTWPLSLFSSSL